MATFDPAAETARYLATLSPEAHARATAYTQGGHWLILWGALVSLAIVFVLLRTGVLARLRTRIEARRRRPWLAALLVVLVAEAITAVLTLPWSIYTSWWREKSYGLTSQPIAGWLGEWAISSAIGLVVVAILLTVFYALLRRAPKTWWIWGAGLSAATGALLILASPVLIEPIFNSYKPAPPGPVRDTVVEMAVANGISKDRIFVYDGSKQSNRYTANVSGLFGSARVAMSDTMFKAGADIAEVRGVVGHEMGHYARHHILWQLGAMALLLVLAFFLVDRLFPLATRLLGAKDVRGISDPAGYPVFTAILVVLGLLGTPILNSLIRTGEIDADNYSLRIAQEPDGLAKALVKTIEYRASNPGKLEEILFYDHPSVSWRVRNAMNWKAAQETGSPRNVEAVAP
ncbi:MAG: M48 family peptidase [Caulobacteraceae bacterium]|nr:MAG: M48 family peptidase [Caulobacteraceae bacterium]